MSLNSEFTAPAFKGDLIEGRGQVMRRGKSMVFVRCELLANDEVVLVASAVIKKIRKPKD